MKGIIKRVARSVPKSINPKYITLLYSILDQINFNALKKNLTSQCDYSL